MSHEASAEPTGMQWKWVILGVVAGLAIVGASYFIVAPTFHSDEIQAVVMLVGYAVTGVIVGYFSPGVTIKEATVAGFLVFIFMLVLLYATGAELIENQSINLLLLLLGVSISWVGGWVGEKLQGSHGDAAHHTGFQWKWVLTGVVLGFALNILFVFLLAPAFKIDLNVVLAAFIASFVATGFIVGYKSPGVTLKEPAVAGLFAVAVDWLFIEFGITLSVPSKYLVAGLAIGFLFSLFGAWLGEKYQESVQSKAVT
ncbi:MAG: hypothetical protein HYY49_05940 [Ignavibacteriales bacterium]|nr:hypothetical protein [Ignavibacteriales bacterium]